jgi:CDP-paratose 2-epimerase
MKKPRISNPEVAAGKSYGFVEWFRPGDYDRTERILPDILASGASYLRTHLSGPNIWRPAAKHGLTG